MAVSSVRSSPRYFTKHPLRHRNEEFHSSESTRQMGQSCVLNLAPSKRIDRMLTWNLRSMVYKKNSACHENCELPEDAIAWKFCITKSDQFNTEAAECEKLVERIWKEGNTHFGGEAHQAPRLDEWHQRSRKSFLRWWFSSMDTLEVFHLISVKTKSLYWTEK